MFKEVNPKVSFPQIEEKIIKYWKENKTFEKSVESRPNNKPWTFLDGPPFVTGMPHYGSLLSSLPKDVFGRYWTMKGYRVRRVWGWDGHGLPIENKVENALQIKRKKDIEEKIGVKKFIEECKKYVREVSQEWEWYVDHIGRWVDFKNAYKTWDFDYMESVMWVFKQMYDKGYIYKGLRVSLYCPHCATPISNFEVAMDAENYKRVTESGTIYKYPLLGEKKSCLLAWSTTPWNKLATPALAVNPMLDYVKVEQNREFYILAKSTLKVLKKDAHKIIETFKGKKLIGKKFQPHYDFYKVEPGKKAFVVIGGKFVTAEEGTGIVTLAVYGEEDLEVMQKENIQMVFHVDEEGRIKNNVPKFAGMKYLAANKAVNEDLMERNLIYRDDSYTHSVAHCWRCGTRLFFNPQDAWYVNVQILKERMKKNNKPINWVPKHFKTGRFLKSMENAPDWNISRNRYWGSPVPVWECECQERFVPGSVKELEEASGKKINDLHKPEIDDITVKCKNCGRQAKRTPEVLDSWIEAGSASFAERHYPFDSFDYTQDKSASGKPEKLEDFFPPDFIAEYTGQIRAWFYVLHVIGTALYDSPAFKNVLVEGVILGTDGRKMSKNFKNYPDPKEMLTMYGGDALRLYLLGSPVMKGEDIRISEVEYRNQVRGMLLILWNVYNFFVTYANADQWSPSGQKTNNDSGQARMTNVLDRWILSRLQNITKLITRGYEEYNTSLVIESAWNFLNKDVSTWYVRRSRDRVGPTAPDGRDKNEAHHTLWTVLVEFSKLLAPIAPFITEEIFRNLTGQESVHLSSWPVVGKPVISESIDQQMQLARNVVEAGHAKRKGLGVKVRIPLGNLDVDIDGEYSIVQDSIWELVLGELNVKNIIVNNKLKYPKKEVKVSEEQLWKEGEIRELLRRIQGKRKELGLKPNDKIILTVPKEFADEKNFLMKRVLAKKIIFAKELKVSL
ncbi:isoleucine--tRNA ligase [Candidatus Roizmanbacteria bacterium RIFCSPLOWO2_01_FULL_37_12]|uniref:Isoleucine--tRNA ligase n=1 Tax=Candidatus Roizmanbacteria bacterium RIFCSPLOWO2_01_FULL_37_12 TaxID=1802056 RepID=A0A1F7I7Y4_9BACT|nr:MAG: isoleucine--tRNA ligase [Candidatus Roizmanbacteria bacterium RIFCSPLOWO2_01_FULL_37_12]